MVKDATRRKRGPVEGTLSAPVRRGGVLEQIPSETTASITRSAVGQGIERTNNLVYHSSRKSMAGGSLAARLCR